MTIGRFVRGGCRGKSYCESDENVFGFCVIDTFYRPSQKDAEGVNIYVRTGCLTLEPLGPANQDPVYNAPGVAMPCGNAVDMLKPWLNGTACLNTQLIRMATGLSTGLSSVSRAMGTSLLTMTPR